MRSEDVFHFEGFTLDLRRGALRQSTGVIDLRPKSFAVLCYLVENAGRLVSKDELIQAVWPNVAATDESLTRCVSDVRLALQDQAQRIIRTVPRRGYLFDAAISRPKPDAAPSRGGATEPSGGPATAPPRSESATEGKRPDGPPDASRDATDDASPNPSAIEQRRPERRQLTVLVCELAGLAALSTRLDPEDLREVTAACHRRCAEIIERRLGFMARYSGDGVLAYFGYTKTTEHDAERAVQAGLDLVEAIPQLPATAGISFRARVGVATGLVVIGEPAASGAAAEHAVVGGTPNLAARLQALAGPGTVVISAETQNLTGGLFDYRDLGAVALPGFAESVPAWQVLRASAAESRFEALRATTTPLVGRDEEVELLLRRWTQAKRGEGGVVLLSGEPGIGKSRIAETILQRVSGEMHSRLRIFCSPHHQDSALHPVIALLERAAGFQREDGEERRLEKLDAFLALGTGGPGTDGHRTAVPLLADLLSLPAGDRYAPLDLTPEKRKEKTLQALTAVTGGLAAHRPLLMLCEDAHWMDPTTGEVLDLLIDRAESLRILLIVTFRPEFKPSWVGRPQVTLLSLSRLPPRRRVEMIGHLTGDTLLPEDIIDQISERTDGVPLFIEELTKAVVESDLLVASDGRYVAAGTTAPRTIPSSLQESLLARLDRLASTRVVAQTAAALGRQFTHELISAVAEMPQAQLDIALEQLVQAELIFRRGAPPDAEYTFKHALVQEAAYGTMLRSQRQALHAHIAAILAERFPEMREAEPELLAYHFTEAGLIADAVPLWAAAGQHAASRTAHAEAVAHLQTALGLARQLPADGVRAGTELQLLIGLVVSLGASRGYAVPEVGKALAEARAICDSLGNIAEFYAVYRGLWAFLLIAGELDGAEEMARRCTAIGEETGLAEQRIEGESALGYILFAKGELEAARRHLEHSARLYHEHDGAKLPMLGTQDSLVQTLSSLLLVLLALGDEKGAARVATDLSAHARSLGRHFDLAFSLSWLAFYELLRGNFAQALPIAEQALGICREHGYPLYELVTSSLRAHALGRLGQAEQVLAVAEAAVPAFEAVGMMHFSCFYLGEAAALQAEAGDIPGALRKIDEAIAAAHRHGDRYFLSPLHRQRAEILARDPQASPAQVAAALTEAIAVAEAQGAAGFAGRAAALLASAVASGPAAAEAG